MSTEHFLFHFMEHICFKNASSYSHCCWAVETQLMKTFTVGDVEALYTVV